MNTSSFLLVLAAILNASSARGGEILERWHWRNPLPQGNALHNVTSVNGRYVATGEMGTLLTSNDGTNWVSQKAGTTLELRDCAYGAGKYVVVGDFGTVLTSTDAQTWTSQYAGTFYSLKGVTFAAGLFVAVGEQTTILTSADGVTWVQRSSGSLGLFDVIQADGLFIASGGNDGVFGGHGTSLILTSPDASVWTYRVLKSGTPFTSLAWGSGQTAAVTRSDFGVLELWTSANGVDWQPKSLPLLYYSLSVVSYGDGQWVLAAASHDYYYSGNGVVLNSDDLTTWSTVVSNTMPVTGLAFGGKFVAGRADGTFLTSSNGLAWANPWADPVTLDYFHDFEFLNGTFLGLGYDRLYFSPDGARWTNVVLATNTGPLLSITYGKGLYVAGGEYRTVWISTDGVNWTNPAPGLSVQPYVANVVMAYGNGVFVGASGYAGDILTSSDGTNWTVQQLQTNASSYVFFRDIEFGNGRFVAVTENATATSTDGTNWFFNPAYNNLQSVAAGNGLFVAAGYNVIATSADGTNWTKQSSSVFGSLRDVTFGNGIFMAVGANGNQGSTFREESPVWISTDAVNWSRVSSKTPRNLSKAAFGNSTFVISGAASAILQSDPLLSLTISAQPQPLLQLFAPADRACRIEYRDETGMPKSWAELITLPTNGPSQYVDLSWTNSAKRFYRAVLLP